jgi:ribosomal protein S18 acetylase RimI-like enzyme
LKQRQRRRAAHERIALSAAVVRDVANFLAARAKISCADYDRSMPDITIRRATPADLPVLGRMGALLMRTHYAFDQKRFLEPGTNAEEGYAWFLGEQLKDDTNAVVLVAERPFDSAQGKPFDSAQGGQREVIGYVYAALEPISWKELRDACGFIHDIVVEERGRRSGVATALMDAAIAWLKERGAPRVVLGTAEQNVPAQRLFARMGFRRTMVEMTREL